MKKLTPAQVDKKLQSCDGWSANKSKTKLSKVFESGSYIDSLAHVARVAVYAEVFQHHPDVELTYGKVKITLTSHDVKGVTAADFDMVKRIEKVFAS
jgi:4a-hydroxytetrahydrobiopterin dehydratase